MIKFKTVTCLNCGWVSFQVSREYAEVEVKTFNDYFKTLSLKERKDYYGNKPSSIKNYESCQYCSVSYKNFRDSLPDDCPDGVTMGPIISREE